MTGKTITYTHAVTGERRQAARNTDLKLGESFCLIGRTLVFKAIKTFRDPLCGYMVHGMTDCGRMTSARVIDTIKP